MRANEGTAELQEKLCPKNSEAIPSLATSETWYARTDSRQTLTSLSICDEEARCVSIQALLVTVATAGLGSVERSLSGGLVSKRL